MALYPLITDSLDSCFCCFNSRRLKLERQSILYYPLILNYILIGIKYTKRTPRILVGICMSLFSIIACVNLKYKHKSGFFKK